MISKKSALTVLHLSTVLMAGTGLFSHLIKLPAWDITGYRTWIASLLLFAWVWWREGSITLGATKNYWRIGLLGALLCVHWITFFYSMQVSSVAIGMLSMYIFPVMTVFIEPFFTKTQIDWRDLLNALFVFIGIYFLVPEFNLANNTTQGVLWGLVAAFTFALRNVLLRHWFRDQSAARAMGYQVLVVALLLTPVIAMSTHTPTHHDIALTLLLGIVFTAFAHTVFGFVLRVLQAKTVGLVACMQPVYAVFYGIIFLDSIPDTRTLLGGAIILGAAIYESVRVHNQTVNQTAQVAE